MKSPSRSFACALSVCLGLTFAVPFSLAKGKGPWEEHIDAGRNAMEAGDFTTAESLLKQAMEDTRKFKDDDVRLGTTYYETGELNIRLNNYTLAKEYFERAQSVQQRILGAESLEAANSLYGIALCDQQLGDQLGAEIFLKRVHEIWRKKLGAKDPKLVSILPSMAAYSAMKNDLPTSETYYKQLIDVAQANNNQEQLGTFMNLLATTLGNEGKLGEAKDYASRAIEIMKKSSKSSAAIDGAEDNLTIIKSRLGEKPAVVANTYEEPPPEKNRDQAQLAAEQARIAKEQAKAAEKTRIAAERVKAAELARLAAEKNKQDAETARLIAEQAKEADKAKRVAAEQAKKDEEAKIAEERSKAAEASRLAAEQEAKNAKIAAAQAKKQSEDLAREKTLLVAEGKQKQSELLGNGGRKPWQTDRAIKKPEGSSQSQNGRVRYLSEGRLISGEEYKAMLLSNESLEALKQEKYKMAVDILNKALDLCPTLPSAHTNIGMALNRLGKPDEAIEHLQMAISIDPTRSAPWVNLATSFQSTGRLKDCIETYHEYLRRFPKDSAATFAAALIKNLQKEADEQDLVIASNGGASSSDYFPFTTVKGTVKWTDSRMPVKIYIAPGSGVQGYKSEYHGIMADAFKSWSAASQDRLKFNYVNSADKSDIECIWTTDYSLVGSVAEGGEAQTQYTPDGIEHVRIVILTADPSPESPLTQNQVQAVCLHEIGHSLGLSGHSPTPGDVMFCSMPSAELKVALSPRDVGTIKHLYRPDVQIALKPSGGTTIASASGSSDKRSVNNEGVELMSSHAYAQAIEKFETALKLDPEYETAKENLSTAYNNYALDLINNGKEKDAESLMQKAMKLQTSLKSAALKMKLTTMHNYALVLRKLHREKEADRVEAEAKVLEQK